jgi:hypothetical protein
VAEPALRQPYLRLGHCHLPRDFVSQLSLHSAGVVAMVAMLGVIGIRLVLKTAKLGVLLAVPAIMYLLHLH